MACTFDKDGNLLRFESGGIWFNATHYHEDRGDKSRDFPMGSLQSSCGEYEHRSGKRGTMALIEAEKAAWMASLERFALMDMPKVPAPDFFAGNSVDILFGDSVEMKDGSRMEFTKESAGEFTLAIHEERVAKVTRDGFTVWPPPKDEPKPKAKAPVKADKPKATPKAKASAPKRAAATPNKSAKRKTK